MIRLYSADGGDTIGEISEEQLQFLKDNLEEESEEDREYYLTADTLDVFEEEGCPPALLKLLREALGDGEGLEVGWEEE
ncbi:MAG: galactosyldiacylglycerol synthase [Deltaproteobacteria bacterium]|nr:galactosyldiacylglycerol synthase [Deltaproteobacteria bacterium]